MIKAVVFDLDGVYFDKGKKNFVKNISEKFNVDKEVFWEFFIHSNSMKKYKRGEISKDEFWNEAIVEFHIESTPDELLRILKEGYEICPNTVELTKNLRERGIRTIVCSNNFRERVKVLQERFNFLENFDFVVLSYEYGILKPVLLKKVIEVSGLRPEEIVIIDDNEKTIEYAKGNGFIGVYCKDSNKIEIELKKLGVL